MRRLRLPLASALLGLACITPGVPVPTSTTSGAASESSAVLVEGTGTYGRPIGTTAKTAQQFFDQGLRLTWGYYFPEAAASFQEGIRHDPEAPMLHWGLAFAVSPNPNSRYMSFPDDPAGVGKKAIARARTLARDAPAKDRAFIDALSVRYDDQAYPDRTARDRAYRDETRALMERFPDDPDAATLYADAIMTLSPWVYWAKGAPLPGTLEALGALERAMEQHPEHPGANHLYLHLLEASPYPERAVPQAERLEALMPHAGHIVHMPSHIYIRVGRYADAIATNERSIEADRFFLEAWGDHPFPAITSHRLSARVHAWHANDFIRYAATVQGNYARALATARSAAEVAVERQTLADGRTQRAVAAIGLVHRIFGKWDAVLAEPPPAAGYPYLTGMAHYVRGSAFLGRGERERAREELEQLRAVAADPPEVPGMANPPRAVLQLATRGLEGELAQAEGDLDVAIKAFEQAVTLEDRLRYIEPPDWSQSMRLHLGAALLEAGRAGEAERVYRHDLQWNQRNGWAMFGLWQSLVAQGREAEAEAAAARQGFEESWKDADVTLTASRF